MERTQAGLAAARGRGRLIGRPRAMSTAQIDTARELYDTGRHSVPQLAAMFRVSDRTMYRALERV